MAAASQDFPQHDASIFPPFSSSNDPRHSTVEILPTATTDPFRAAQMALEIQMHKARVAEVLNARDAAVQRLADAYISIRQKTAIIEQLQREKDELLNQPQNVAFVNEEFKKRTESEIARLEGIIRGLQEELRASKNPDLPNFHTKTSNEPPPKYEESKFGPCKDMNGADSDLYQPPLLRLETSSCPLLIRNEPSPIFSLRTSSFPSTPEMHENKKQIVRDSNDLDYNIVQTSPKPDGPEERAKARHAILAKLPIPSDIPSDALKPITISPPISLHEFLGNAPNTFRNFLSNYRVFQQLTTIWCPEREEHGYLLTPVFKCSTNPRVITAHRWAPVDVVGKLSKPTECFYNKDGKWYYAGVYIGFRMEDLTPREWEALSTETTQAITKETLAARKNISPQNLYEIAQLYAAGALKVGCVGLKCVGFSNGLYRAILEQANKYSGNGNWKEGVGVAGSGEVSSITTGESPSNNEVAAAAR